MTEKRRQIEIAKTLKRIRVLSVLLVVCMVALCIVCLAENVAGEYVKDNYTYSNEEIKDKGNEPVKPMLKDEPSKPLDRIEEIPEEDVPLEENAEAQIPENEAAATVLLEEEEKEEVVEEKWYTEEEYLLLVKLIYLEAGAECYEGQVAVGAVVMNRMKASGFPNTITDVIYQKNQFSPVKSSKWNNPVPSDTTAYQAAIEALNGVDPTNGALFFYNPKISTSEWIFSRPVVKVIGNHNFAK